MPQSRHSKVFIVFNCIIAYITSIYSYQIIHLVLIFNEEKLISRKTNFLTHLYALNAS